jgi:hypothetical protein
LKAKGEFRELNANLSTQMICLENIDSKTLGYATLGAQAVAKN